jgi:hypothetical protein
VEQRRNAIKQRDAEERCSVVERSSCADKAQRRVREQCRVGAACLW